MQVFKAGTVTSLATFFSTPSLINGGLATTMTFLPNVRHYGALYGRYAPLTATEAASLAQRNPGKVFTEGMHVFPPTLVTSPAISNIAVVPATTKRLLAPVNGAPTSTAYKSPEQVYADRQAAATYVPWYNRPTVMLPASALAGALVTTVVMLVTQRSRLQGYKPIDSTSADGSHSDDSEDEDGEDAASPLDTSGPSDDSSPSERPSPDSRS